MTPLDRYREKRDFEHTPEPAGAVHGDGDATLSFVIQKHAATRLHYDVRLEIGDVLVSWAVPKGPSLDPRDKRLAVHVEDHPLEYGSFEGIIPAGEYGGGTVMVWDTGTYEPELDMAAGLERGDLKFTLHGTKLHGSWALVRMKPRPGDRAENWLLIKHRDEHAQSAADYDVTVALPNSAATGRSIERIADAGEGGDVPRPEGDPVPFEAPMQLATLAPDAPSGPDWIHEVKYDGYRLRIARDGDTVRILTRSGADWTERFPPLVQAAHALPMSSALLDGEVVALRADGIPDFGELQRAMGAGHADRLVYFAFDLLHLSGHDLRGLPLSSRKELLAELLPPEGVLRYAEHLIDAGPAFHAHTCDIGLEGSVSKRADRPYEPGRSRDWIKVKCRQRQEFVVLGWTEPKGSRAGFGALLLGVRDDTGLRYAGRVGSGFSDLDLIDLSGRLASLASTNPPVPEPAELARIPHHWVQPHLVAEVAFQEWTREGALRQPSFVGMREDKPAAEVVKEHAGARFAGVMLSSPEKVLFAPGASSPAGITKADLARYYERIADHIMPHVSDRPLTLVRCPHGSARDCFYQKHPDTRGLASSLHTLEVDEHGSMATYLYVKDLAGLISLVQLGVLEIHAWNSHASDPYRPDRVVFDLDPGPDVAWPRVRETALLVRDALGALGLTAYVKTTGGKGLHVVAPIVPERDYTQVLAFCRGLVERLAASDPARLTARMTKALREGRIYIDYLRNARGATAVVAYSTRAREGAPVGVPLSWDELTDDLDIASFNVITVPARLEGPGAHDPWQGYEQGRAHLDDAMFAALGIPIQGTLADA